MSSVSGFVEFADDCNDFAEGLEDCAGDGMEEVGDAVAEETGESVADDASDNAPVDTGKLSNSIFMWPMPLEPMERIVIAATEYAKPVEYGTRPHIIPPSPETTYDRPILHRGSEPYPYLRPALRSNTGTMHDVFEDEMEDLFRRNLR